MSPDNTIQAINTNLYAVKNIALEGIQNRLANTPNLEALQKQAQEAAENAEGYIKKADTVAQAAQYGADYLLSRGALFLGKNYLCDFVKMYAKELGIFAVAYLTFQAVANPQLIVDVGKSVYSGVKTTVGNYTSLFSNATKVDEPVKPKVVMHKLYIDEGFKETHNGTKLETNATFKADIHAQEPIKLPEPVKQVNETAQAYHFDAAHPFLVEHNGMQFTLTPYHSGTLAHVDM